MSFPRLSRTLSGALALGVLAVPALVAINPSGLVLAATQQTVPVEQRFAEAPHVFFPVASIYAKDLRTFGKRPGTEIQAPCGAVVRAATAGTVLLSESRTSGPNLVRVVTSKGKLVSYYGYMRRAVVTSGQIVAAGQQLGNVGEEGIATRCSLYFALTNGTSGVIKLDPSRWLNNYVGKQVPQRSLFENSGFVISSFNVLGASHTPSARYAGYAVRTPKQVTMLEGYGVDVVGLQEFENRQRTQFLGLTKDTYGIYPPVTSRNSANSIIWRKSTMEFVSGSTIGVPYFNGNIKQMPVVLLKHKATGRSAYVINVHNPASIAKYGDQSKWRARAIAIEKAKVIELRETGKTVFLTGDLNDREKAFCPLTANKLMISANSVPSMTCAPPARLWIDWVFAAGPARFTMYAKDSTPKDQRLSDHPIILTRAHLAS